MDGVRSIFIPPVEGESFLVQDPKTSESSKIMERSSSDHFSHRDVLDGKLLSKKVTTISSEEKHQLESITRSFGVFTKEVRRDFFRINQRIDRLEERLERIESNAYFRIPNTPDSACDLQELVNGSTLSASIQNESNEKEAN